MQYGIVIPAHNEAENIEAFVNAFIEESPEDVRRVLVEIILVENGSKDDTLEACKRLEAAHAPLVRVFQNERGSYGEAIKRGMNESQGTHLSILECDAMDVDFVLDSIRRFERGEADFIVGSKQHPESLDERPWKRRMLTRGFNLIINWFIGYPGSDTHGLKSIKTDVAKKLCGLAATTDELFQTEIVLIAWRLGYRVIEAPVKIREKRGTPIAIVRRVPKVINMVRDLRATMKRFPK